MTWLDLVALPLFARFCLVVLFPFSALDKIINRKEALEQARSSFLPGAQMLLVAAIVVEVVAPLCIVAGWHDRLAAVVLAGFCVVTAVLYHQFWACGDFWASGESRARSHFWDFLKNFGLVGGLLLLVVAGSWVPVRDILGAPLSSAPVEASPAPAKGTSRFGNGQEF